MKNNFLLDFLKCLRILEENGFNVDFTRVNNSFNFKSATENTPDKTRKISSCLLLTLSFFFTNFLFAQQPACNLNGILEVQRLRDGGQNFIISSEVIGAIPGTVYRWEFKSNDSQASFATQNGLPSMTINPGNKNGNFILKLTVINPPSSRGAGKTCYCTKSVSIGTL